MYSSYLCFEHFSDVVTDIDPFREQVNSPSLKKTLFVGILYFSVSFGRFPPPDISHKLHGEEKKKEEEAYEARIRQFEVRDDVSNDLVAQVIQEITFRHSKSQLLCPSLPM